MSKKQARRKGRPGRGALLAIGLLFFASGLIRLADGTGDAVAREVEAFASKEPGQVSGIQETPLECTSKDAVAAAMASLRDRTKTLEERERQIELRMLTLKKAETDLQRNMEALVKAEEALSATIALADGAAEQDIAGLTAVYERMKPKEVSAVFEAMDPSFAAGFLGRMKPDAAASVMAGLSPAKAYSVSIVLAGRNMGVPTE